MFSVNLDDKEYKVKFAHDRYTFLEQLENGKWAQADTACHISQMVGEKHRANSVAFAHCSATDNFCYNIGRKIALQRALDDGNFSREERKLFWDAYWKARGRVS